MSFILLGILNAQAEAAGAGSYDLLETTILDSDASSVSFTSLNSTYGSTYKHLQIRATIRCDRTGNVGSAGVININGASATKAHFLLGVGGSVLSGTTTNQVLQSATDESAANIFNAGVLDILDAFDTSKNTTVRSLSGGVPDRIGLYSAFLNSTAAVDSIELDASSQNWVTGSRFSLYGIKAA